MTDPGQMSSDGKAYERMMGWWSKRVGVQFLDWLDAPENLRWVEVGCGCASNCPSPPTAASPTKRPPMR